MTSGPPGFLPRFFDRHYLNTMNPLMRRVLILVLGAFFKDGHMPRNYS
jgi:hypothetical protein